MMIASKARVCNTVPMTITSTPRISFEWAPMTRINTERVQSPETSVAFDSLARFVPESAGMTCSPAPIIIIAAAPNTPANLPA